MIRRFRRGWIIAALLLSGLPGRETALSSPPSDVDFDRDIRPILSEKCFRCHGPDRRKRKARLRLDTREGAFADRGGYRSVVPGKLDESELYVRITEENPEDRMPPPEATLQLTTREIELIRSWIEQGAEWRSHWSFVRLPDVPIADVPLPPVNDRRWPVNPVDHFVLARLERERITPAPPATKERLLRRVTFSLTGLPPTLEEIEVFLADDSPEAYQKVVDRLLASAAYGERLAVDWLDLARFADTYGYQADRYNHLWPWRDWVLRTLNRDLPYDEWITWQIAGDLLPGATREQVLATAFNRNHRQTNEGGSVNEEFRVEYNADRVRTTSMAFLGLTMECARCHEHKYDPISQKEYYQFFAFFNSTDESGLYSHFTDAIPCPTLLLYRSEEEERKHTKLKARIAAKEAELEAYRQQALADAARRGAAGLLGDTLENTTEAVIKEADHPESSENSPAATSRLPLSEMRGLVGDYSFDEIVEGKAPNAIDGPRSQKPSPGQLIDSPRTVEGKCGRALLFDGENSVTFKGVADFRRTDPFSLALWLRIPEEREKIIVLHHSRAGSDAGSRGYELLLENGRASFALIHFWPGNAIKVATRHKLRRNEWTHVAVTYDGSSRACGLRIFVDGRRAEVDIVRDHLWKGIQYGSRVPLVLAARFRGPGFRGGRIDELKIFDRHLTAPEVDAIYGDRPLREVFGRESEELAGEESLRGEAVRALLDYRLTIFDEEYRRRLAELKEVRERENDLVNRIPEIMVMGDLPTPRPTYVLRRGAYDAPGEVVEPSTPRSILEFDEALPRNRLGLARWLVDRRNPLTARVAVNRHWQRLFGRGLVSTPEDFGSQGERPSHPRLLDWLAGWFMDKGWSSKALDRLIVMSATYRQSSIATPAKLEKDPENKLLARGPSRRLSAEAIRDGALAAAGLLQRNIGGPSIQPGETIGGPGSDKENRADEKKSSDREDRPSPENRNQHRYRRSLYTYIKRTAPSPYLMTFDGNNRETCIARRQTTNTPLQALLLLNDPLFTEASRMLGKRIVREGGESVEDKVTFAFRVLTGRQPQAGERHVLAALYREQLTLFRENTERAKEFLDGGHYQRDGSVEVSQLAATAVLASAIMNFDETFTLR